MTKSGGAEFGRLKSFLWPIHRREWRKLLPMLAMFFLISLNYNVLRTIKDTLIITAKSSGAEVIPFIEVWVMLPTAVLMTWIFTKLANRFSRETVCYLMTGIFLGYFLVFITLVYPYRDNLHPHAFADYLQTLLPAGMKGFVAMIRYWTYTTFYVMSELWSPIILFTCFWGFANEITDVSEAKRFYSLFSVAANFSGVVAGEVSILLMHWALGSVFSFGQDAWHRSLVFLSILVLTVGVATLIIFRWMNMKVLTDPRFYCAQRSVRLNSPAKQKLSVRQSFQYLWKDPYLLNITVIVLAYNIVINLVEVMWKYKVRQLYPNPVEYGTFMNQITTVIGVFATTSALLISGNCIRRIGWTFTALVAPVILLVTSVLFFGTFFFGDTLAMKGVLVMGVAPLALTVFFGSAQNALSRAAKYTVFDETKEMAFIPLESDYKMKGKAAIDGVCSRMGKSGGSVIHQSLLIAFSSLQFSAPYVAVILFIVIALWIRAVLSLGVRFRAMTEGPSEVAPAQGISLAQAEVVQTS